MSRKEYSKVISATFDVLEKHAQSDRCLLTTSVELEGLFLFSLDNFTNELTAKHYNNQANWLWRRAVELSNSGSVHVLHGYVR
jgi:hypothetical protein